MIATIQAKRSIQIIVFMLQPFTILRGIACACDASNIKYYNSNSSIFGILGGL